MAKNTFYININEQNFNETQTINKNLVFKSLVRNTLKNKEEIKIVDDNSSISSMYLKKKTKIGTSVWNEKVVLKNRFNNELRLNLSLGETNFNASIVNKFKTTFLNILKRRNFNRKDPAIILEPKKGGFYVYYSGVYGFLPQSQFWLVWKSLLKINSKQSILTMLGLKRILPIRLPLKMVTITLCPANKQNNFSPLKKYKYLDSSISAIFIFKKIDFEKNGKQEDKKKNLQFNTNSTNQKNGFLSNRIQTGEKNKKN